MKKEIKTEIIIKASASTIWKILLDFKAYASWNPFIRKIEGIPKVNNQLKIRITPPNGSAMTFRPIVVTNSTNTKLEWKGKLLFQGLFDGKHTFELIENQNGTTTFLHKEEFSGFIIRFFDPQKTKEGFRQMNLALKIQSENQTTIS